MPRTKQVRTIEDAARNVAKRRKAIERELVAIVWSKTGKREDLATLAFHSGAGAIRVYHRQKVDPRLGEESLPYLKSRAELWRALETSPGQRFRLAFSVIREIWPDAIYETAF